MIQFSNSERTGIRTTEKLKHIFASRFCSFVRGAQQSTRTDPFMGRSAKQKENLTLIASCCEVHAGSFASLVTAKKRRPRRAKNFLFLGPELNFGNIAWIPVFTGMTNETIGLLIRSLRWTADQVWDDKKKR